tara:strand:+ start:782 stop:1027 length:246 start_codon:yes stop_codon:yes gene_type:complete
MLDARQCIDRAQRNVGQHRRQEPQAADRATFASIEGKNRGPRSFPDLLVAAAAAPSETAWTIAHTELAWVPSNIGSKSMFS